MRRGNYLMSMETNQVEALILRKTCRLPVTGEPGDGATVARQFDAVLMCTGFKCSRELMERLSALEAGRVIDIAVTALPVLRELAGDHVRHNTYFKDFPANVPDTMDFWANCLREAVLARVPGSSAVTLDAEGLRELGRAGFVLNLLSLPSYGRYQHTFEEMLASHEELIPAISDRVTVLHLGGEPDSEAHTLYSRLAGSAVPLSADDTEALRVLAGHCIGMKQPEDILVRESRAIINAVRLRAGGVPLVTTVTDVLRLACELSGGDVSLQEVTRFKSLPRRHRGALMAALDAVIRGNASRLADVNQYAERWKRLAERIHPHEFGQHPDGRAVFAVARGDMRASTLAGQAEALFASGNVKAAANWLTITPGRLWRSADRLLRADPASATVVVDALTATASDVSGRVLLSVREHLQNRLSASTPARIFANRRGRAWTTADSRDRLDAGAVGDILAMIDAHVMSRLPDGHLCVDKDILGAALPLSGKPLPDGLGVFPRGSVTKVEGELLRFFIYWRQKYHRTDYDLSALFLDESYGNPRHISWTNLRNAEAEHSGDLTDASPPHGASEFINIRLTRLGRGFVVPQVLIYAGEGFHEADEAFFGFMTRDGEQEGQPFEARTVRMKSGLFGESRTAVPLVFFRGEDGVWYAKWLHLYLRGHAESAFGGRANTVEGTRVTASLLARSVVERDYLRVNYLVDLWSQRGGPVSILVSQDSGPVTYVGLERPEWLPEASDVYTLDRLGDLIPA